MSRIGNRIIAIPEGVTVSVNDGLVSVKGSKGELNLELNKIIDEVFEIVKPTSIKDLGKVMKEITPRVKNRCDMSKLNSILREKLN